MASSEFCMCSPLRWNNLKNHLYGWENPYHDRRCSDLASARFSSAHCMAKDMDDLYQPSHRGDCRQGNKLQVNEGKSVVMQLCGEVWWNQAHGNELVLAGGRLQTMIRGAGIMGYGGFNPCEKDSSMCILHCEAGFDGPGSRHIAVEPYQFSCIHRMASSSLNCLSNSYSCRASTDMLAGDGGARSVRTKRFLAAEVCLFSRFQCKF